MWASLHHPAVLSTPKSKAKEDPEHGSRNYFQCLICKMGHVWTLEVFGSSSGLLLGLLLPGQSNADRHKRAQKSAQACHPQGEARKRARRRAPPWKDCKQPETSINQLIGTSEKILNDCCEGGTKIWGRCCTPSFSLSLSLCNLKNIRQTNIGENLRKNSRNMLEPKVQQLKQG